MQIDEAVLVYSVVGTAITVVGAILGGVWGLLASFKRDMMERIELSDKGLQERQKAFCSMMDQHIAMEDRQFAEIGRALEALRAENRAIRLEYVTKTDLEYQLAPIRGATAKTVQIVDARAKRGDDPVSGRPPEVERRRSLAENPDER